MKVELTLCGQGAVTPAGVGVNSLFSESIWPIAPLSAMNDPNFTQPIGRIDFKTNPVLKKWQSHPRLRRASRLTVMMAEAAHQALQDLFPEGSDRSNIGVIAVQTNGPVQHSCDFLTNLLGEQFSRPSPAVFTAAVFNSAISHLGAVAGLNDCGTTVVGDDSAWASGLLTAAAWLKLGRCQYVLVITAEEIEPVLLDIYRASGWLGKPEGFIPCEGACAALFRSTQSGDLLTIDEISRGYPFSDRHGAIQAAKAALGDFPEDVPLYPSAGGNWHGRLEKRVAQELGLELLTTPFPYCGEAWATSASWHTLRALNLLKNGPYDQILQPIYGLNHQISAIKLSKNLN